MEEKLKLMDKRVLERNLDKGLLTQKELDSHLKKLPNLEGEYEELNMDAEEEEGEGEESEEAQEGQA